MSEKLEFVRNAVREIANEVDWKYHIVPVLKYANELVEVLVVDKEVVELAVLLHDVGRFKFGSKDHHLTGIPEAEKILRQANYSDGIIKQVTHCIESHRGSVDIERKSIAAEIVANADAMSHFDIFPLFFLPKENEKISRDDIENLVKKVADKFERNWNQKLTIPEASLMMREKYRSIRIILDSIQGLM